MSHYQVNASITYAAWIDVEADSPEAAVDEARGMPTSAFEYDAAVAEIEFNVIPEVELLHE